MWQWVPKYKHSALNRMISEVYRYVAILIVIEKAFWVYHGLEYTMRKFPDVTLLREVVILLRIIESRFEGYL